MAYNVKFLKGAAAAYAALAAKDANTFYYTTDDSQLYLGEIKLSNKNDVEAALVRIAANEAKIGDLSNLTVAAKGNLVAAINAVQAELSVLTGGEEGATGGIADMIESVTGDISELETENTGSLVEAINELAAKTKITISTETTTEGMSKSYTIKQDQTTLGVIDIPKDMVVSKGEVVVLEDGEVDGYDAGTYIKLTVANGDILYIEAAKLVDIYKGSQDAGMENLKVRVTVNQATRVIEAFLAPNSVGTTELIDGAVTEDKIEDGAITTDKIATGAITEDLLSTELKTIVGGIQSAVTKVETGENNGTIKVTNFNSETGAEETVEVSVKGLGSAAYTAATAYDAAGSAEAAETSAKSYTDEALTWGTL